MPLEKHSFKECGFQPRVYVNSLIDTLMKVLAFLHVLRVRRSHYNNEIISQISSSTTSFYISNIVADMLCWLQLGHVFDPTTGHLPTGRDRGSLCLEEMVKVLWRAGLCQTG